MLQARCWTDGDAGQVGVKIVTLVLTSHLGLGVQTAMPAMTDHSQH
jgi:hypothetical protein